MQLGMYSGESSGITSKHDFLLQAAIRPPTFVFFVNDAKLFPETYRRYMEKQLRSDAGFSGTPIRIIWRSRRKIEKNGGQSWVLFYLISQVPFIWVMVWTIWYKCAFDFSLLLIFSFYILKIFHKKEIDIGLHVIMPMVYYMHRRERKKPFPLNFCTLPIHWPCDLMDCTLKTGEKPFFHKADMPAQYLLPWI